MSDGEGGICTHTTTKWLDVAPLWGSVFADKRRRRLSIHLHKAAKEPLAHCWIDGICVSVSSAGSTASEQKICIRVVLYVRAPFRVSTFRVLPSK